MCRMVGFSSKEALKINPFLLDLNKMAKEGMKSPHKDGWGIYVKSNERIFHYKSMVPIFEDEQNFQKLKEIRANIGILHARKGSSGLPKTIFQVQPFLDENNIAFCHNGGIKDLNPEDLPSNSDSAFLFNNIKDFRDLQDLKLKIKTFVSMYKLSAINFLMIKSDTLYSFCFYRENKEYYTMWYKVEEDMFVVKSERFEGSNYMKNGELIISKNGRITFRELVITAMK